MHIGKLITFWLSSLLRHITRKLLQLSKMEIKNPQGKELHYL